LLYEERQAAFETRLSERIAGWEARAMPLSGVRFVAYHQQWEYLADWLGLTLVGYIEDRPGIPPSPRHVNELTEEMKARNTPLLAVATFEDVDASRKVAERAGARLVVLPASVGGVENAGDYFSWFETILATLLGEGS
jgi:ABC-type Zn uptake system ZnuABC Zn-binding protein ZnuA